MTRSAAGERGCVLRLLSSAFGGGGSGKATRAHASLCRTLRSLVVACPAPPRHARLLVSHAPSRLFGVRGRAWHLHRLAVAEDLRTSCFICNIEREDFEQHGVSLAS